MRKFFAAIAVAVAALLLLPVLLVRSEPLVGRAEVPENAEKVGARAELEPSPSPSRAALAPVTPAAEPEGFGESDAEGEPSAAPEGVSPPPGVVSVSGEMEVGGDDDGESNIVENGRDEDGVSENVENGRAAVIAVLGEGEMALEDYVAGVVAAEMGPSFPTEARRAQAVAARSLALYRVEHPKHGGSAVCLSAGCCMAWKTPDEGAVDAAQSTRGVVATYDGEPIMAAFFSRSDGETLSAAEVWGGGVPYLVSVASPWETDGSTRGHGVGMSQYGAAGMAAEGAVYDEILRHYYTGVEVG